MFKRRKIIILGLARSGFAAAKVLASAKKKNQVILTEKKSKEELDPKVLQELENLDVDLVLGDNPIELVNREVDYIIKNPGIAIDHPYVLKAKELGIPVINELELAYQLMPKEGVTLIGITGTNGKTTTTTLIYEMIKASNRQVYLAGNIGYPLCDFIGKIKRGDIVVVETSCQQLENIDTYKPNIAVLTNIDIAHLEFMKTYEHYKEVKMRIMQNQTSEDVVIINDDCQELDEAKRRAKAKKRFFSLKNQKATAHITDKTIYVNEKPVIALKDIKLIGEHNYQNIMAAILAVKEVGVDDASIKKVLTTFKGVEHRLEYVDTINGVDFYNDTEATNIKCTQIALASFNRPTILILGGYERNQNFADLIPYLKNTKAILAIGSTKERVLEFGKKQNIPTYAYNTQLEALSYVFDLASPGDVVLLSPAAASWDQYKQAEDRGAEFKDWVKAQKNLK